MKFKGLIFLFGTLIFLLFVGFVGSQNGHLVTVNYLIAESEMRVSVLMAVTMILGIFLALLTLSWYIFRLKWRIIRLERQHKKLTKVEKA
ncbi:MAG: putative membrane protein [Paraglaciecola sp.]|jgi:putative membrane protein